MPKRIGLRCCGDEITGRSLVQNRRAGTIKTNAAYKFTKEVVLTLILFYKGAAASGLISAVGMVPSACRYLPSCSDYATECIKKQGFLRGGVLSLKRLARCHPWAADGED